MDEIQRFDRLAQVPSKGGGLAAVATRTGEMVMGSIAARRNAVDVDDRSSSSVKPGRRLHAVYDIVCAQKEVPGRIATIRNAIGTALARPDTIKQVERGTRAADEIFLLARRIGD